MFVSSEMTAALGNMLPDVWIHRSSRREDRWYIGKRRIAWATIADLLDAKFVKFVGVDHLRLTRAGRKEVA